MSTATALNQPPLQKGHPLFGNSLNMMKDPLGFYTLLAKTIPDLSRYRFFRSAYYFASHPDTVRHVLVGNPKNYIKNVFYEPLKMLLGKGLLTNEGSFWLKQRRLAQPAFHRDKIAAFADAMSAVAQEKFPTFEAKLKSGESLDLHREMMGIAFAVVDKTLLARKEAGDEERLYRIFNPALDFISKRQFQPVKLPLWLPLPSHLAFKKNRALLNDIIDTAIHSRKAEGAKGNDLVSMLLQVRDEDTGEGMSENQLRDEVMTIFLAGFETTANALTWTFYLLDRYPEVLGKVKEELASVLDGRMPEARDMGALAYTQRVISESLRLFPPAWTIGRESLEPDTIRGFPIPKGATIALGIYAMHHDPRFWERPEEFDPDRFLPERLTEIQKHAYLPFGGGPRFCIGNNFAIMEMTIVLALLIPRFRFRHDATRPVEIEAGVTMRPKTGFWVKVEKAV